MNYIIGGRRTGKTQELIEISAAAGARIVCMSKSEAERIMFIANELGFKIKEPWTVAELMSPKSMGNNDEVLIDDLEGMLCQVLPTGHKVAAITIGVDLRRGDSLKMFDIVPRSEEK